LSQKQGEAFDKVYARANSKDAKIAAEGQRELKQYALDNSRPSLQTGWLDAIAQKDPALYKEVRAQAVKAHPEIEKKLKERERVYESRAASQRTLNQSPPEPGTTPAIAIDAAKGHQGAFDELSRRAGTGDAEAKRMLPIIIQHRSKLQTK
jgi:hypothetical protein